MLLKQATLDEIGRKHGTDKSSLQRDRLQSYERFFSERRQQRLKVLEIGTLNGTSLKTWADYFQFATVIGADINPHAARHAQARVFVETLDPSNLEELVALGVKHGPFDIIIDDGSHADKQAVALRTLFAFLNRSGIYVVENLQADLATSTENPGALIRRAIDMQLTNNTIDDSTVGDAFLRTYGRDMNFFVSHGTCLIEKRYVTRSNEHASHMSFVTLLDHQKQQLAGITAHMGDAGDVFSATGVVRSVRADVNIQGFQLQATPELRDQILCRGRLADGSWSEWVQAGSFVGSRDKEADLTGFSVRLSGALADRADVTVIGAFRGDNEPAYTSGLQDCVGTTLAALHGMQVLITNNN